MIDMWTGSPRKVFPARLRALVRRIGRDEAGVSIIEFAISLPVLLGLATVGMEIAGMMTANMQVSQLAISVADNASRLGQTDNSAVTPTVAETDIDAVMFGAMQQGESLDLQRNGRVILTSLERDATTGKQYIHWQRCAGELDRGSRYGNQTDRNGLTGPPLPGMGRSGNLVTASNGQAVMFVEVYYTYQPLFANPLVDDLTFRQEAAFLVRDDRNLGGGGGDGLTGTTTSVCP